MEETVNKNIEKYQTPHWRGHRSIVGNQIRPLSHPSSSPRPFPKIGWCKMNYPSVLVNQRTKKEETQKNYDDIDLSYMH